MAMQFTKAEKKRAKLRLAIAGPAGSGKTTAALEVATGIGGKIAVIDTERGSASLYADRYQFDALDLDPPYSPERFIEAIKAAETAGYDVLILDSMTHEWNGSGGCLEINEALAAAKFRSNTWAAWNETTPRHRKFVDTILQSPMHIIATMRSKTETVQDKDSKKVTKVGTKTEQRDGTDYEFTVMMEMDHGSHLGVATKDRTRLFADPVHLTRDTGAKLLEWLNSGVSTDLTADEVAAHVKSINDAQSLESLKTAWETARSAATRVHDTAAAKKFDEAKDNRKKELSK